MPRPLARLVPASLTGRLVATVVLLVALAAILITAATTLAMRSYLNNRLDGEVDGALNRASHAYLSGFPGGAPPQQPDGDHDEPPEIGGTRAQGAGTVTAVFDGYGDRATVLTSAGSIRRLSEASMEQLERVSADGHTHVVDLPSLGAYRVKAVKTSGGSVIAGLSTSNITDTLTSLLVWGGLLTVGGVVVAGVSGLWLVRRQLRPLREVAATAHEVTALPLSSGEIGTTVRVPPDLTDERSEVGQVGAALNTMLAHVEHALDERHRSELQVRQFVADASHELRTPLSTIHGYAELSRRTRPVDPEQLSLAMTKVEAEATRMSSLVEDLLLLARLDAGRPLARDEVDVTKLVLETVSDARVVGPQWQWRFDLPDEPLVVPGDEQRLHQIITNLLTNARRHTPPGTTVTAGVRSDGDEVVIFVQDDGPGMSPDLVSRAFERFTRGDSSRTRESGGAGLGLSLVQAISVAHGGSVSVASQPGRTRFEVRLPALASAFTSVTG